MGGSATTDYGSGGGVGNVGVGRTVGGAVGSVGVGVATGSVGVETGSVGVETGSVGSDGPEEGVPGMVGDGDPPELLAVGLADPPGADPLLDARVAWSRAASFVMSGESGARLRGLSAR